MKRNMGLPWWSSGWDHASVAGDMRSLLGQGTKIPQATRHGQKKEKEKKRNGSKASLLGRNS